MNWGTLVPEGLGALRRQQDLGLAAAVRYFNDAAVPGLGALWFPAPLVWSVLAVSLAEDAGRSALPIGNAIEALAMLQCAKESNPRLRGSRKLQNVEDVSFKNLSRRGVYVVQPFRMGMVQPLVALGFVHGSRYGAFRLAGAGQRMLNLPEVSRWRQALSAWVKGAKPGKDLAGLSPLAALPQSVCKLIKARTLEGAGADDQAAARRRALVQLGKGPSASALKSEEPLPGLTIEHWRDLRAGAALVELRDLGLEVLRGVEDVLRKRADDALKPRIAPDEMPETVLARVSVLRARVEENLPRLESVGETDSLRYAQDCLNAPRDVILRLAERDGSVICLRDGQLMPGPAAGDLRPDHASVNGDMITPAAQAEEFAPQLYRLRNLHCLMEELVGRPNPASPDFPSRRASL
ncbi:hypothetical protein K3718_09980 [Leisingera aquaemixtae]|uniref:Integrating conjugative element relaxase, PFGI-1 class n=2 Tax=Leisingera aquaemixtae TaxID=1396826 RepID=A0ABY5WPG4_9RHOB|nr:hypothetical protein K3718_09980 [Leisingera aquaemixtae]